MPFGLGATELLLICLALLLLFGAKRIPEIAGSLGKGINSFKRNLNDVDKSIRDADTTYRAELERPTEPRREEPAPEPKRLL
ncbi:MAG: twin-arginine translocase TatA/TatE family subunit [Gemmatimonadaceae bacterium]|jgi:sec-independent protein translocase protein TatA|nr:twin-arginine translocase TatA/TatE family subunit [Gemmatimonadaceae bacterium]